MIEIIKSSYLMYSSLFSCAILLENSCKYFLIKIIYQINLGFLNRLLNMHIIPIIPIVYIMHIMHILPIIAIMTIMHIIPIMPIMPIIHVPCYIYFKININYHNVRMNKFL